MNSICGSERAQPRQPDFVDHLADHIALGSGRKRHIHHVFRHVLGPGIRVERMLEETDHQHTLVSRQDLLGPIAVMHVEVDHRHPLAGRAPSAHGARRWRRC